MNILRNLLIGAGAAALAAMATAASAATETSSATVSATLQSPLTIDKDSDMAFGTLVKPSTGTLAVSLSDAGAITYTGGVATGTPSAAVFTVNAPSGTVITPSASASGGITALADWALTDSANPNGTAITMSGATQELKYGAGFTVAATQAVGEYTGTLSLTVTYD